jgi:hypothetical protein
MNNKSLRILIVEAQHLERFFLERTMNSLGYYRIAPMASSIEAMVAIRDAVVPFDLLIINAEQDYCLDFDLVSFCKSAEQLRHSIIYGSSAAQELPQTFAQSDSVHMTIYRRPDIKILKKLMKLVDPQSKNLARQVLVEKARRSTTKF